MCATYEVFEQLTEEKERPITSANRYKRLQTAALGMTQFLHLSFCSNNDKVHLIKAFQLIKKSFFWSEA